MSSMLSSSFIFYNNILFNNFEHSHIILLKSAGKGYSRVQILMVSADNCVEKCMEIKPMMVVMDNRIK